MPGAVIPLLTGLLLLPLPTPLSLSWDSLNRDKFFNDSSALVAAVNGGDDDEFIVTSSLVNGGEGFELFSPLLLGGGLSGLRE